MLAPNGMHVLAGLDKSLNSHNSPELPSIQIYESDGGSLGKHQEGLESDPTSISSCMNIHEILLDNVEKRGIKARYGAKVKSLEEMTAWWCDGERITKRKNLR